jgi:HAMP domain-containing protein
MTKKKITVVFLFLLAVVILLISQYTTEKRTESATENGVNYEISGPLVQRASLTRHYSNRERVSLMMVLRARQSSVPDLMPLNFTLTGPGSVEAVFVMWLEPFYIEDSVFPELNVNELEVLAVKGMNLDNSSKTKFVGEITQDGNYTLLFTSTSYTQEDSPLNSLALSKIIIEKEQPYTFLTPLSIGLMIVGLCLAVWVIRSPRPRHRLHHETDLKKKLNRL